MINENCVFLLFPFCKTIKGYAQSAIYDLELNKLHSITNNMYYFIEACIGKTKKEIYYLFNESETVIVKSLITSLIDKRFVRFVDKEEYSRFLPIQNLPQQDSLLDNFVIDIDDDSDYDICKALEKISNFHLQVIQIRFLHPVNHYRFSEIIRKVYATNADSIEIVIPFVTVKSLEELYELFDKYQNITNMYIWGAEANKIDNYKQCRVNYMQSKINCSDTCGLINSDNFLCNKKFYLEAMNKNTCLAKKCAIDKNGIIKNCPYMANGFGHIDDCTVEKLQNIVMEESFTRLFSVKKDDVQTCNVCEFRYACFDCRVFISKKENLFSKPLKCNYNPYIAKWNNE